MMDHSIIGPLTSVGGASIMRLMLSKAAKALGAALKHGDKGPLAERAGISPSHLSKILAGKRSAPDELKVLAEDDYGISWRDWLEAADVEGDAA